MKAVRKKWDKKNTEKIKKKYVKYGKKMRKKLGYDRRIPRQLKKLYGISIQDFNKMVKNQGGLCEICHKPPIKVKRKRKILFIDHNHKTGKVRGLLCMSCNMGIGMLKDNIETLKGAITYLVKYDGEPTCEI